MKPVLLSLSICLCACSGAADAPAPTPLAGLAAAPEPVPAATVPDERVLSADEFEILREDLVDLRAGVRPFSDESMGICTKADKTCGTYLGVAPETLATGDYLLWAELRAPRLGSAEGWPVSLDTTCTIETQAGSRTSEQSRTYTVKHAGEERGFRLRLREFSSPGKGGATRCEWTLRSVREGDRVVGQGVWTLPAAGA